MNSSLPFSAALWLLTAVLSVAAQGDNSSTFLSERKFRVLGWNTTNGSDPIYYANANQDIPVAFNSDTRSIFYKYQGADQFDLYNLKPNAQGKLEHVVVAHVDIAKAGLWPLLVLFPDNQHTGTYSVVALADDLTALPPGAIELVNFTKQALVVKIADESYALAPGEIKLTQVHPPSNSTALYVQILLKSLPVYGNNWAYEPQRRTILFSDESAYVPGEITVKRLIESSLFPPDKHQP